MDEDFEHLMMTIEIIDQLQEYEVENELAPRSRHIFENVSVL